MTSVIPFAKHNLPSTCDFFKLSKLHMINPNIIAALKF